jgi:hypothetical protein
MRLSHMRSAATVAHPTVEPLALDGLPSSDRTQRRHPAKRRHLPLNYAIKLTEKETAEVQAILREAQEKVVEVRRLFGSDTRSYFLFGVTLSVLSADYTLGTRGKEFAVERVEEWVIAGMPEQFTSKEIVEAIIKRAQGEQG